MTSPYRDKSVQRAKSPDELNDYVHVTRPAAWMVLAVLFLLVFAGAVWFAGGSIKERSSAVAVVENGEAVLYVSQDQSTGVVNGLTVEYTDSNGETVCGTVESVFTEPVTYAKVAEAAAPLGSEKTESIIPSGSWAIQCTAQADLADGVYGASIITGVYRPIRLLFGGS